VQVNLKSFAPYSSDRNPRVVFLRQFILGLNLGFLSLLGLDGGEYMVDSLLSSFCSSYISLPFSPV
jgi:hypothetical protein